MSDELCYNCSKILEQEDFNNENTIVGSDHEGPFMYCIKCSEEYSKEEEGQTNNLAYN